MFVISNAMATVDPVAASFEMNHFEKSILILKFGKKSIFFLYFCCCDISNFWWIQ